MDLYKNEQQIYNNAISHANDVHQGAAYDFKEFDTLTKAYGKLLKEVRRLTKTADGTADILYKRNLDLSDKVYYDPLTGIYNRRFMEESLINIIAALSRSSGLLTVMILDIDFFKKYNDTYGHAEGDVCLKIVAQTLSQCMLREADFVARYGGEEFVVVLPHTDEESAHTMAARILGSIVDANIPHEKNEAADCVTVSIGITTIDVKHTHEGTDYVKCADAALYKSKQSGRNRYTYAEFMG